MHGEYACLEEEKVEVSGMTSSETSSRISLESLESLSVCIEGFLE